MQFVFLFLGSCLGHTAILVHNINWWYGVPIPRLVQKLFRFVYGLAVLAWPVVLWQRYGLNLTAAFLDMPLGLYVTLTCAIGLCVLPVITIRRLLRGRPETVLSNHARIVDVAAQLGQRPLGRGKHRILASLPFNEIFAVDMTEKTLALPNLPEEWDGLTILHLSDLHFCGTPDRDFYRVILDTCNEWEPDIVAVTGDIVDSKRHHRWIGPLLGRLRWKEAGLAILGNHDLWHEPDLTRRQLRKLGFRVLANSSELLEVRGRQLLAVGHEGPWFRPGPDLSDCPKDAFRMCLSHTPDNIGWAKKNSIDLMLAGHNHGGQVRVPIIGSILVPSCYSRKYDCGVFHEPPTVLHVSRGLGGQYPLRFRCRPEVTKIVLRLKVSTPRAESLAMHLDNNAAQS